MDCSDEHGALYRIMDFVRFPPEAVMEKDIVSAEEQIGTSFPAPYRSAIINHGLPHFTIALLGKIVELELDIADVSEFLNPSDIIETTFSWHELGLPIELVAFAADCSGNLFCFSKSNNVLKSDERPILFFDHEFGTTATISASFPEWLNAYCKLAAY